MKCGLCDGNGRIECGNIVTGAEWLQCDGCRGRGEVSDPDPERQEAARLAYELLAAARDAINEAMELADKHKFALMFGLIDDRHYFPQGAGPEAPDIFSLKDGSFHPFRSWCGFSLMYDDMLTLGGRWLSSGEYGDCD